MQVLGFIIAFAAGALFSAVNYFISDKALKRDTKAFMFISPIRAFIQVGCLVITYFIAPYTPWQRFILLLGAAAGLTASMAFFTVKLLGKANKSSKSSETSEGSER